MVTVYRPPIDIGYKHNARNVLSFTVTDNSGSTKTGIPYLYNYPDQFTNVAIRPVAHPLFMSKNILLMRLTPTTNKYSLIWYWINGGLLSVVGCGYVRQLL